MIEVSAGLPASFGILLWSVVLGLIHFTVVTIAARLSEKNLKWAAGPRDKARPLTGVAARLDRSYRNFLETYPFFVVVMWLLPAAHIFSGTAIVAGWVYLAARLIYIPAYALGWALRPLFWGISLISLLTSLGVLIVTVLSK
ncbi:MAG: MAPEG family protein [Asticcacaulis sp.]